MKHDYTGKFVIGQVVYLNDKSSLSHGRPGTVTAINLNGKGYPYRVDFKTTHAYHPESELCAEPIRKTEAASHFESMDISSGFGISGAGSDDYSMATERDVMIVNNAGCQWKHGTRYDEDCECCGRNGEVCNDCGCCERCHYG